MKIEAVIPPNTWYFVAAVVWLVYASFRLHDLYVSRDLSEDWGGPGALLASVLFLRTAYRVPVGEPDK